MSVESKPSSEELKKYLKDASLYEENMDYEDMLDYYKVIKCSESTAQQEEAQRSFHENVQNDVVSNASPERKENTIEFNFDGDIKDNESPPKTTAKTTIKSSKLKLSTPKSSKNNNSSSKGDKVVEYDVFECPPVKHKPLDVILYERKYDLPPHCDPKLSNLTTTQRAKIISNFHRVTLEKFYQLHRESLNPAPWGKPIPSSDKFNGTLDRSSQLEDDDFQIMNTSNDDESTSSQEIYTSRHGRQTKRKVYTDLDEDVDSKKSKKDEDKPFEIEKKPIPKRQNLGKLSNQDIMKRSKLFSEPVKSVGTEKMFDVLKSNEKKWDADKQHEKHESSNEEMTSENDNDVDLIPNSQESDDVVELKPKEMPFIPRRVPPSIRGRRAIGKRQLYTDLTKTNGSPSSPAGPATSKASASTSTSVAATATTVTEKSQKSTPGKEKCPICSLLFFLDEIEAHASSCGLFTESESNFDMLLRSGNVKKIKCDVCDKEMLMNQDYEVHVNDCIRKAKANDKL